MADEEKQKGEGRPEEDDDSFKFPSDDFGTSDDDAEPGEQQDFGALSGSGGQEEEDADDAGGLPPLSDFESSEEEASAFGQDDEEALPPLSDLTSDVDSDSKRETPAPEYEGTSDFDTPTPSGTGFQDLTADSDFSPETPEVGPGPESDMDTPMFDSAFGEQGDEGGPGAPDTSAPTQAMETPMFGQQEDEGGGDFEGFDEGAFGGGDDQFGFDQETPAPDFSTDTGTTGGAGAVPPPTAPPAAAPVAGGDDGGSTMSRVGVMVGVALVFAIVGIVAGPWVANMVGMPAMLNPYEQQIEDLELDVQNRQTTIASLQHQLQDVTQIPTVDGEPVDISPEEIERLIQQKQQYTEEVVQLEDEISMLREEMGLVAEDLEQKNEEFVIAQQEFEDLLNETAITQARQEGLLTEVNRLQGLVGELEEANTRRAETLQALQANMGRLVSQIEDGLPLTPPRYSRTDRIERAESLMDRIDGAGWVDASLLDEYTELYLRELEISEAREYFFARIPVRDRFGVVERKWAECVMNGNWSVYYRTLDGRHIGIYMDTADEGPPQFEFVEDLPSSVKSHVEHSVYQSRVPDYEQRLQAVAEREREMRTDTAWQRVFNSM